MCAARKLSPLLEKLSPSGLGSQARAAHEYLATLLHGSRVREGLDTASGVTWDIAISLDTETGPDTGFLLTAEEIQLLYTRAILSTAAQCPQPDSWPGTFPRTLDTLLTVVTAATSASRQQLRASVARPTSRPGTSCASTTVCSLGTWPPWLPAPPWSPQLR